MEEYEGRGYWKELQREQTNYECRFSCPICLSPRLRMVYGLCQHAVCDECLYYQASSVRRFGLHVCPICQQPDVFPITRPDIPERTIEAQKLLGIRECSKEGCEEQCWEWELSDHLSSHRNTKKALSEPKVYPSPETGARQLSTDPAPRLNTTQTTPQTSTVRRSLAQSPRTVRTTSQISQTTPTSESRTTNNMLVMRTRSGRAYRRRTVYDS